MEPEGVLAPRSLNISPLTGWEPFRAASKNIGSEEKPDAELDVTRLVEIGVASRESEDTKIIEIQAR